MTQHNDRDQYQDGEPTPEEALNQTASENRAGDLGDQGNDLRFAEEQQLINQQAAGEFPVPAEEDLQQPDAEIPALEADEQPIDIPGEELHDTHEADASDDPLNAGGDDT
ncbi:hypothetical protein [Arthrobacter sp. NPDC089319]|uniref:hypothetical protein n=1 Tax=Arthrobacter sp. NPDC089319 TaxID=3155915 RepID=UPI0034198471